MLSSPLSRRRFLSTTSLAVVALFGGCSGTPDGSDPTTERTGDDPSTPGSSSDASSSDSSTVTDERADADASTTTASSPATASSSATKTPRMADGSESLDLREANVVAVEFEQSSGSYRFSVTLHHDDDGEEGYANWWQVETLDGDQLGRRTLLHAHSTAPFTRSETISVPDGTEYVVVRGHDQTHGYGGQAMVANVETGETEAVRQGPEPQDFSGYEPRV